MAQHYGKFVGLPGALQGMTLEQIGQQRWFGIANVWCGHRHIPFSNQFGENALGSHGLVR